MSADCCFELVDQHVSGAPTTYQIFFWLSHGILQAGVPTIGGGIDEEHNCVLIVNICSFFLDKMCH